MSTSTSQSDAPRFRTNCGQVALLAAHVVLAGLVLAGIYRTYDARQSQVADLAQAAAEDRQATNTLEHQVDVQQAILGGLHEQNPYVIELQARSRLGWSGPHEMQPPPRPDQLPQSMRADGADGADGAGQ